ncbi:MAG: NUDIX hydrolase [Planctomycetes bacterium]|nr:NUDIX hydrolase [Planctomycetota bacterium]
MNDPDPDPEANPWQTLSSREIYANAWIRVREDAVLRPDGQEGIYGVVECRAATGVVAIDAEGNAVLVGQYRYPTERYSWETIQGGAEPGEDPLSAIKRELREEGGLAAGRWELLGAPIQLSNCVSDELGYLYLARDLEVIGEPEPEGTEVLVLKRIPFAEAVRQALSGEISDAMSVIGLCRAAAHPDLRVYSP